MPSVQFADAELPGGAGGGPEAAPVLYPLNTLPALHSRPGAMAKLYLDFDGSAGEMFGLTSVPATPAYTQDTDATTFSDSELTSIAEIWARVSEKYSPFNIDVTTVSPGTLLDRESFRIVIGGAGAWAGAGNTGVAKLGGFSNSDSNTGYAFSANLQSGFPKYVAEVAAHEAGHGFGLMHQSSFTGTTETAEYNPGNSAVAPVMGSSYYSVRGVWYYGPTVSSTTFQDDMAILAGGDNGFGYAVDDHGSTVGSSAASFDLSGTTLNASGVIERTTDLDVFRFTTLAGSVSFTGAIAQFGGMLDMSLELRDAAGNLIASSATASLSESLTATVAAGTYYVIVKSAGAYGDVGQYTLTGTLPPGSITGSTAGNAGGAYFVAEGGGVRLSGLGSTGAALSYSWDLDGDGVFGETGTAASAGDETGATPTFNATGIDGPASRTVWLRVTDAGGQTSTSSATVNVVNAAPKLLITGDATATATQNYTLNLSHSDVGSDTISSWTIDWGDGSAPQVVSGSSTSVIKVYATAGSRTIVATATDEDGTYTSNTIFVSVQAAPAVSINGHPTASEGSVYTLSLNSTIGTPSAWYVNWGDGSATQVVPGAATSVTHVYADNKVSAYMITASATVSGSNRSAGVILVAVSNVAPSLVLSGGGTATAGSAYTLSLSRSDPGADTVSSWAINWGDGSAVQIVTGNPSSVTKTYTGAGTYVITATATDEDGTYAAGNSVVVVVSTGTAVPAVAISGNASVNEGASYTLNLSAANGTPTSWSIDWGDGSGVQVIAGNPSTVLHVFADNAARSINASAVINGTTYTAAVLAVTVANVAPSLTLGGNASANEGSSYTLTLGSTDPGTDTITSWSINWGDGTAVQVVTGNPPSVTHTFADNGSYSISATATDEDGTYAAVAKVVAVANVAPTLTLGGNASANEGSAYTLTLSETDPGNDTVSSWSINWGDGSAVQVVTGNPSSVAHTFADNGSYTITATATDEDGTYSAGSKAVSVANVAPTLTLGGNASVNEGASYTLTLARTDPGADTISSWSINWGDGSAVQLVTGNPSSVTHTFADNGSYTVTATATDEDGTYAASSKVVSVANVTPTLTLGGGASVNEGSVYTLTLASSDPGTDTISSWSINWGDGSAVQLVTGNPSSVTHTFADNGTYTVTATATDEDGTHTASSKAVSVANVAPTLSLSGSVTVFVGATYTLNLSASDPGNDTVASWTINWGDGSAVQVVTGNPSSVTKVYAAAGSYSITATATDEDGTFSASGKALSVVAPGPAISGNATVNEGSSYTLNLTTSTGTPTAWTINWGDGSGVQSITGNPSTVAHTFADNGTYNIVATATIGGTVYTSNTLGVGVANVAPTLTVGGAAGANEGSSYTLTLASSDPGTDTITSWSINWGDGSAVQVVTGNPSSVTHTFADNGNYTIIATATDEDGSYAAAGKLISVANVAPTLSVGGNATSLEGSSYTLTLSKTDPGNDTVSSWSINWGDGSAVQVVTGNPSSVTHTFADNGAYTVIATATDEDGSYTAAGKVVTVSNVAPTLTLGGAASANEGATYTLTLSRTDPGTDTISSWSINWGDGSAVQVVTGNPSSVTHVFADNGTYTVSATATDEDGTYSAPSKVVSAANVAPTLTLGGAAVVNEGSVYTLTLSRTDPGSDTISSWSINWGDGTAVQVVTGNPSSVTHTFADNGSYTVTATATDEDGTYSASGKVVGVANVAPTLTLGGNASAVEGSSYTLTLGKSDPGTDAVSSWSINWGDGSAVQVVAGSASSVTHTFADNGNYTITATATDEDGTYGGLSKAVTVANAAPTLAISGNATGSEGAPYTLSLSASDAGNDTISKWTITWGDGVVQLVTGNPSSVTHTYADNGNYTISATATDEDGSYAAGNSRGVAIANVAPTLTVTGASSVQAGALYTLNLAESDPGADTVTSWTINWGDGSPAQTVAGTATSVTKSFANAGTYTITVTATDEDGTFSASPLALNVAAAAVNPTLNIAGAASANEGSQYTLNLSASNGTPTSWTINWGDGSAPQVVTGNPSAVTHTFADNGGYNVSATAVVAGLTFAVTGSVDVAVANVAPTLTVTTPDSGKEGSAYTIGLSATDPGADTIQKWVITWGDGTVDTLPGNATGATHVYADNGTFPISVATVDEDATFVANTRQASIANVAPTLSVAGAGSVTAGTGYTLSLGSTDAGNDTVSSWTINWGDGNVETIAGGTNSATHTYANAGQFSVAVSATDEDGTYNAQPLAVSAAVAPAAWLSAASAVQEKTGYTVNFGANVPVTGWTINWGDGTSEQLAAGATSATHTYTTPGDYTVSASAVNPAGGQGIASNAVAVSVADITPQVTLNGPDATTVGAEVAVGFNSDAVSARVISKWRVDWGDGVVEEFDAGAKGAKHAYGRAGSFRMTVSAIEDGKPYDATHDLSVVDFTNGFVVVGSGDFDNDGAPDLVRVNPATGVAGLWLLDGTTATDQEIFSENAAGLTFLSVADADGNGTSDLIWRDNATGAAVVWHVAKQEVTGVTRISDKPAGNWFLAGAGDFDGDRVADLMFRNVSNAKDGKGSNQILHLNADGTVKSKMLLTKQSPAFSVESVTDLNNDGLADIVWRSKGTVQGWIMAAGKRRAVAKFPVQKAITMRLAAVDDFNNDGSPDMLWQDASGNNSNFWMLRGGKLIPTTAAGAAKKALFSSNPIAA